jgi:hypothetical protein
MTLSDQLRNPKDEPVLSMQQELPRTVKEALMECLITCSELQNPRKKSDLRDRVHWF